MNAFRSLSLAIAIVCSTSTLFAQGSTVTAGSNTSSPGSPNVVVTTGDSTTSVFRILNPSNADLLSVVASGKVGIGGVPAPLWTLDINGNLGLRGAPALIRPTSNSDNDGLKFMGTRLALGAINSRAYGYTGNAVAYIAGFGDGQELLRVDANTGATGYLALSQASLASLKLAMVSNGAPVFTVQGDGKVGIGTASPGSLFHVVGGTNQYAIFQRGSKILYVNANYSDTNLYSMIGNRTTDNMGLSLTSKDTSPEYLFVAVDGKVGVGTTSPQLKLSVHAPATINGAAREVMGLYDTTPSGAGVGAGIAFGGKFNAAGQIAQEFASIQGFKENGTDGDFASALVINTRVHGGQPTERVRVDSQGNVGIGIAPTARLHVSGNIIATGSITGATVIGAVYQDVAEWVPATTDVAPGTVVVLNPHKPNEVMASTGEYDTRVAGVVSAQPGIILGVAGESKEQIATTGRVRVKVDATRAPIAIGDLLVTSGAPGVAMKSEPMDIQGRKFHQPGTIIGKALEELPSGTGEILVLLSMQ